MVDDRMSIILEHVEVLDWDESCLRSLNGNCLLRIQTDGLLQLLTSKRLDKLIRSPDSFATIQNNWISFIFALLRCRREQNMWSRELCLVHITPSRYDCWSSCHSETWNLLVSSVLFCADRVSSTSRLFSIRRKFFRARPPMHYDSWHQPGIIRREKIQFVDSNAGFIHCIRNNGPAANQPSGTTFPLMAWRWNRTRAATLLPDKGKCLLSDNLPILMLIKKRFILRSMTNHVADQKTGRKLKSERLNTPQIEDVQPTAALWFRDAAPLALDAHGTKIAFWPSISS
jgi:hypothetical protein